MVPSPVPEDSLISLSDAVTDLKTAAQIPSKQRAIKITGVVGNVSVKAHENGLPPDLLESLIDLITLPNHLDQASLGSIIRNLYPAGKVNDECVIKVVGCLGHGRTKPSFSAQAGLIKWLVMVYDVLENQKVLSQLYGVLFNLLDSSAIRASLCHLLSVITRRKHVRPFRIQALLELARKVGNEAPLTGLLRVYKDYYPDIIVGIATAGKGSVFSHPNPEWRQRLGDIQEAHTQRLALPRSQEAFRVLRRGINGTKRGKVSVIPDVHTSRAQESSTTLEEIESVKDLVGKLEKIELPNQLVSVVGDPLLQKLLQLKSTDAINRRLDYWLRAFFEDHLSDTGDSSSLLEMLSAICEYARYIKRLPPACIAFLEIVLKSWNGVIGQEVILDILVFLPFASYNELQSTIFEPLEASLLDNTPGSQVALLNYYTKLLHHWTVLLLSTPPTTHTAESLILFTGHVNKLCLTILQTDLSIAAHATILNFYDTATFIHSQTSLQSHVRITTPPAILVYTLLFTSSLCSLSRLCGILALYKRAFEAAMVGRSSSAATAVEPYPRDYVNHFNGFLMDVCNCIWRSRAFTSADPNALGCLIPPSLVGALTTYVSSLDTQLSLTTLFSLSFSPTVCGVSNSYLRELEDKAEDEDDITKRHAGPVTQQSLKMVGLNGGLKLQWADYRLGVLMWMEDRNVKGIGELMYNTMKPLMASREKKQV